MISRSTSAALGLGALALAACQSTQTAESVAAPPEAMPPMDVDNTSSAWPYLSAKYDKDGDGRITPEEYDRDEGQFERIDWNGDGVLTQDEFDTSSMMESRMASMRGQLVVSAYFQEDEDSSVLPLEELDWSFSCYDLNQDEVLVAEEFDELAGERRQDLPDDFSNDLATEVEPWPTLLATVDANGDGAVARTELVGYFKNRDDGDGVWAVGGGMSGPVEAGTEEQGEPLSGPKVGTVAPDFTLSDPHGANPVTLSGFKGKKPVALIFGSYT